MRHINSLTNPLIKSLRSLHERKRRRQSGSFLAEGTRIVTEALELGWALETLIFLEGREDDRMIARLIRMAMDQGADIVMVSDAVLAKISRKDNPQMVVATFKEKTLNPDQVFKAGGNDGTPVWVVLDRVRDPGNLGTILRTVDAVAGKGVVLVGDCCDPFSVEAVRASMGAIFNTSVAMMGEAEFIEKTKGYSGQILGTSLAASVDYRAVDWSGPMLLMMGNEQSGLTQNLMNAATTLIRMPMQGRSDSLNLAVATGVALYEFRRHND
jgi:TrmH family RNA methyltransferase